MSPRVGFSGEYPSVVLACSPSDFYAVIFGPPRPRRVRVGESASAFKIRKDEFCIVSEKLFVL